MRAVSGKSGRVGPPPASYIHAGKIDNDHGTRAHVAVRCGAYASP
jgi:hypothetical protein